MMKLCYFLDNNFDYLCKLFLYISILGFIIYLPFKKHWGKIFSFVNSMIFYGSFGIPLVYWMSAYDSVEPLTLGKHIIYILITVLCAVIGLVNLLVCWGRCSNILEIIFLPLMFVCSIGVVCVLILLAALALYSADHDEYY